MQHPDGAPFPGCDVQFPKFLEHPVDVDDRKSSRVCDVCMGERKACAVDAGRFSSHQLLAKEMGDTPKRWLSACIRLFVENTRFEHRGAPQGQAELRMSRYQVLEGLALDDADRAVRDSGHSDFVARFWHYMPVKIAEVARVMKCMDLPAAILETLVHASQPLDQHR